MQPEDRDIAFLWDILEAAKDIHDFVRKTTLIDKIFKEFYLYPSLTVTRDKKALTKKSIDNYI